MMMHTVNGYGRIKSNRNKGKAQKKKKLGPLAEKKYAIVLQAREQAWYIPPCEGIPRYNAAEDRHCPVARINQYNNEQRRLATESEEQQIKFNSQVDKSNQLQLQQQQQWHNSKLGPAPAMQLISPAHLINHSLLPNSSTNLNTNGSVTAMAGQPIAQRALQVSTSLTSLSYPMSTGPSINPFSQSLDSFTSQPINHSYQVYEVDILQKIMVRENLLTEIQKLLKYSTVNNVIQSSVYPIMSEVVELVKAIRFETLEIVERISEWQRMQRTIKSFQYKGVNYLLKVCHDLDFLDQYEEIIEKFCFEFTCNPFAYRGGGNMLTDLQAGGKNTAMKIVESYQQLKATQSLVVDGIEVYRLHEAEKFILQEKIRIMDLQQRGIQEGADQSVDVDYFMTNIQAEASKSNHGADRKSKKINFQNNLFHPTKVKLERIMTLEEEAAELAAMIAHVKDKVSLLKESRDQIIQRRALLEKKMVESRENGKEGSAQHIAAEISLLNVQFQEAKATIKDHEREIYFLLLEKKRKLQVVKVMHDEIDDSRRKQKIKKIVERKMKKEGLFATLQAFEKGKLTEIITPSRQAKIDDLDAERGNEAVGDEQQTFIQEMVSDVELDGSNESNNANTGIVVGKGGSFVLQEDELGELHETYELEDDQLDSLEHSSPFQLTNDNLLGEEILHEYAEEEGDNEMETSAQAHLLPVGPGYAAAFGLRRDSE